MEIITTVQSNNGSINLSLPKKAFYIIIDALIDKYRMLSDNPKELIPLYETVVCLGVNRHAVELSSMIRRHMQTNYNAYWEMYLASKEKKEDGTETI